MLRALRDGAKTGFLKYILLGFLVLAAGGLVLTDVGGFFRGGISNNTVAKGKGIEISLMEFDRGIRRVLARQGMTPERAYQMGLIDQVLRSEIQTRILAKEAAKIGVVPNDALIAEQIAVMAGNIAIPGMSKKQALQTTLRSQGISEDEFINSIRQEISVNLLTNTLASNAQTMPIEQAKALYEFQNEKRNFEAIILDPEKVEQIEKPTDEQLESFYNARKIEFAIPETRSFTVATLESETIAKDIKISDQDARAYYDDNITTYQKPERRTLQQAILKNQQQADEIIAALEGKKSLEAAVEEITGDKKAYLGENAFGRESLIEDLATPVFEGKNGDVIGPVESPLGWHIVSIQGITAPQTTPFNTVKKDIVKTLKDDQLIDELIDAANTLDDQLAGGEELEVVVKEMGLTTKTISGINQAGRDKQNKDKLEAYPNDKAQILEAAFDYNVGESSPVMEMADGRYVVVRIDEIEPLSYTPFEDVKPKLEKDWITEQQILANQDRADKLMQTLAENNDLEAVEGEYNTSILTFKNLKRNESTNNVLSLPSLRQIFDTPQGQIVRVNNNGKILIGRVTSIDLPDATKAEKEIADIQKQNSEYLAQEYLGQYLTSLLGRYKVQINQPLLQQVYGTPQGT